MAIVLKDESDGEIEINANKENVENTNNNNEFDYNFCSQMTQVMEPRIDNNNWNKRVSKARVMSNPSKRKVRNKTYHKKRRFKPPKRINKSKRKKSFKIPRKIAPIQDNKKKSTDFDAFLANIDYSKDQSNDCNYIKQTRSDRLPPTASFQKAKSSDKPPPTASFQKAKASLGSVSLISSAKPPQPIRIKIRKTVSFDQSKFERLMGNSNSKEEESEEEDPYTAFMNAIPAYDDDDDDEESEPTPAEMDAMTTEEYMKYKNSMRSPLKLPQTRSIASAHTLLYRNIPNKTPDLSASNSARAQDLSAIIKSTQSPILQQRAAQRNRMAKIEQSSQWWARLEEREKSTKSLSVNPRKRKMHSCSDISSNCESLNKKRKMNEKNQKIQMPNMQSLSSLKDVSMLSKAQLSKRFGTKSAILNMSFTNAANHRFKDSQASNAITNIVFDEDDAFVEYTADYESKRSNNLLLFDDWSDSCSGSGRHIRNAVKGECSTECIINGGKGWKEAHAQFGKGVSREWLLNHWRHIVWKLACVERWLAWKLSGTYCNYGNVLLHLKYRYETEMSLGKSSTLKRILAGDHNAACLMVLFVSRIIYGNDNSLNRLFVSDGWYEIECQFLDSDIESLVENGDIKIGDKIKICLARKTGPNCEPLEGAAQSVSLQIGRNCVRKAQWHRKLGYQPIVPNMFRVSLKSVRGNGGNVPYIHCCVTKRYDTQYSIKVGSAHKGKIYNAKAKEYCDSAFEQRRQQKMIEIRLRIAAEMGLDTGMDSGFVFDSFEEREAMRRKMEKLKERVRSAVLCCPALDRKVSQFFTCVIHETDNRGMPVPSECTELTVWNPTQSVLAAMSEGNHVCVYNLNTQNRTHSASNIAQLSAGSRAKFKIMRRKKTGANNNKYYDFAVGKQLQTNAEFDMIGVIVKVIANSDSTLQIFAMNLGTNRKALISVEVKQNEHLLHFRHTPKTRSVCLIKNLKYSGYDKHLSLHSSHSYQRTQFISNGSLRDQRWKEANEYCNSCDGKRQIQTMTTQIETALQK